MNLRLTTYALAALLSMAGLAAFLRGFESRRRLGSPGVRFAGAPIFDEQGALVRSNSVLLPVKVPGWSSTSAPMTRLEVSYLPPDTDYGRRIYTDAAGATVSASVVLMGSDRTSIHKPEYCLTGAGWNVQKKALANVRVRRPHGYDLEVQRFDAVYAGQDLPPGAVAPRAVYVFWFVSDGELTASHWVRQSSAFRHLLGSAELQRWAYVSFLGVCNPGEEDLTFRRMSDLIADAVPEFQLPAGQPLTAAGAASR